MLKPVNKDEASKHVSLYYRCKIIGFSMPIFPKFDIRNKSNAEQVHMRGTLLLRVVLNQIHFGEFSMGGGDQWVSTVDNEDGGERYRRRARG